MSLIVNYLDRIGKDSLLVMDSLEVAAWCDIKDEEREDEKGYGMKKTKGREGDRIHPEKIQKIASLQEVVARNYSTGSDSAADSAADSAVLLAVISE